jgi:hypothetical protein
MGGRWKEGLAVSIVNKEIVGSSIFSFAQKQKAA